MTKRRSIHIEGLSHLTAIPVASQIGPLVMSSVIAPFNPGTRDVPELASDQVENIFRHVGLMLDEAGATWNDVIKMNFWVGNPEQRSAIEPIWVRHFPDETSRPGRHTHITNSTTISADFTAFVQS